MAPGVRPDNVTECDVTGEALFAERDPYAVVVPYSTCELEGWSVVQVMVAEVVVIAPEVTPLITGIVAAVENVKLADVAGPPESAEITA